MQWGRLNLCSDSVLWCRHVGSGGAPWWWMMDGKNKWRARQGWVGWRAIWSLFSPSRTSKRHKLKLSTMMIVDWKRAYVNQEGERFRFRFRKKHWPPLVSANSNEEFELTLQLFSNSNSLYNFSFFRWDCKVSLKSKYIHKYCMYQYITYVRKIPIL